MAERAVCVGRCVLKLAVGVASISIGRRPEREDEYYNEHRNRHNGCWARWRMNGRGREADEVKVRERFFFIQNDSCGILSRDAQRPCRLRCLRRVNECPAERMLRARADASWERPGCRSPRSAGGLLAGKCDVPVISRQVKEEKSISGQVRQVKGDQLLTRNNRCILRTTEQKTNLSI